jgi:formylglycine-generating enzyme required for sulfatase activity
MSRAGKFIPGGGGKAAGRTGPIRAPEPGSPPTGPLPAGGKGTFTRASLVRPVAKNQRIPIVIMSAIVVCLLVSFAWYDLAYAPEVRKFTAEQQAAAAAQKQLAAEQAAEAKAAADQARLAATERGILSVDSNPSAATVTIGDFRNTTPAKFTDLMPGTFSITIQSDGYEDYRQDVTITADKPTDLGTIQLTPKTGNLSLSTPQSDVTYTITGPNNYSHDGSMPDKLEGLPVGTYSLTVSQGDWKLSPLNLTIHDRENLQKEIKFPYANLSLTSVPAGATVREGHTVLGQTPLSLTQLRPGNLQLSVDLPPYTLQRLTVHLPDFGNVTKQVTLQQAKDFVAACGIDMVWIPDGGFWAGKYHVRQGEFETVAGYNPSTFRRPNRPVETISWDAAMAFCDKLNDYEKKAGKLPAGYHYTLPTESQWETFSADADINQAPMSRSTTLSSTQDSGASEPNKYGLYDTLGNVWEWCLDLFDDKGDHTLRGGSWLSSPDNFPGSDTRNAGGPKYADRFTGFRVVLVAN